MHLYHEVQSLHVCVNSEIWSSFSLGNCCEEFQLLHINLKFSKILFTVTFAWPIAPLIWQVDYFVDCHYSEDTGNLWVIGGTVAGTMGYFPVNYKGVASIGHAEAVLRGGHTAVVRSVLPMSSMQSRAAQSQGIFGWTGGEDGRLCCWLSDDSGDINRSWISSSMVMRSMTTRKKNRHHPYCQDKD